MTSVIDNENSSSRQAALRSQKLMQTLIFLFFLRMGTILATQSGCCSSRMKPRSMSFMNFSLDHLHDVRTKLSLLLLERFGIRFDVEMVHGYVMVKTRQFFMLQAKTPIYFRMRDIRSCFSPGDKYLLIKMSFGCVLSPTSTWIILSLMEVSHYLKHFSYWRSSYWAQKSILNGSMSSSCFT